MPGRISLNLLGLQVLATCAKRNCSGRYINLMVMDMARPAPLPAWCAMSAVTWPLRFLRLRAICTPNARRPPAIHRAHCHDRRQRRGRQRFTPQDAQTLARQAQVHSRCGGLHFWSLDRDTRALGGATAVAIHLQQPEPARCPGVLARLCPGTALQSRPTCFPTLCPHTIHHITSIDYAQPRLLASRGCTRASRRGTQQLVGRVLSWILAECARGAVAAAIGPAPCAPRVVAYRCAGLGLANTACPQAPCSTARCQTAAGACWQALPTDGKDRPHLSTRNRQKDLDDPLARYAASAGAAPAHHPRRSR